MKFVFILLAGFTSSGALAATDFVYCKHYIESRIKYRNLGMSVGDDGKFTVKQNPTSVYNYSFRNGTHEFDAAGGQFKILIETADGRVKKITEAEYYGLGYSKKIKDDHYKRETVTFEEKNGICYPSRKDTESITPHSSNSYSSFKDVKWETKNSLDWHTEMCRDIHLFIQKNPKIKECRCGNDTVNHGMEAILRKFDKNYSPGPRKTNTREQDVLTTLNTLGSPLAKAYEFIKNCQMYGSVVGAVTDDRIWKSAGAAAVDDSGEPKGSSDAR